MSLGLLIGSDEAVSDWAFSTFNIFKAPVNRGIGIVDDNGKLRGAILFQNYNGVNVEVSYYGPKTLTYGIVKCIAKIAISEFNAGRLTAVTSKRNKTFMRGLLKIGFKYEGTQRCYFGHTDVGNNTGVRFVMFRSDLEKIAQAKETHAV